MEFFFSHICERRKKRTCDVQQMLQFTYKHSSAAHSLYKHIRFCQNNTNTSKVLANIKQYYEPFKDQSYIPSRVKQEITAACSEFVILVF